MVDDPNIRPGAHLGRYVLEEELGTGATATVYLARDAAGVRYAIKVRRRGQTELDRRFLREFESMRLLRVPGVVPVHEAGIEDAVLWFSMDRVHGQPFLAPIHALGGPRPGHPAEGPGAQYVAERVRATLDLGRKLCSVLTSLHEAGFVHRDIKPTNVLVDDAADVHVLDFGIGRYFGEQDTLSATGEVLGTVPYMAPEQLGGLPTGEGVDLFATGLMLHEAIAGPRERPHTTVGWIPKICLERMPSLASLYPEVPRGLSHLVDALLAVDPADRPTAREATRELHAIANGVVSAEWPIAPFVDPGPWWLPVEGVVGHGNHPVAWILEGPVGSGRTRVAEQLHRMALLQGTWTIHLHCRIDRVGGPVLQFVERLIADLDDATLAVVVGSAGRALRTTWPHLPVPVPAESVDVSPGKLAPAIRDLVERACAERAMLLVFHDLEQIDPFTARLLPQIAPLVGDNLGLLFLHESRWSTPLSRDLVARLEQLGVGHLSVPRFEPEVADAIAARIAPSQPPTFTKPAPPHAVLEEAYRALAGVRRETFTPPDASLWPLALADVPVPLEVLEALVGDAAGKGPWTRVTSEGAVLAGPTAALLARSRLASLGPSAAALAAAWERAAQPDDRPGDRATLWLLASETARAVGPATRAAVLAERLELYPEARQWLLLLDTLRTTEERSQQDAFELAVVRARVALYTDVLQVRPSLVDTAERFVRSTEQEHRIRLLRAEYGLRLGEARTALVSALRVGSLSSGAPPWLQVQALLLAFRCRMALQQLAEAVMDLDRAEAILAEHPDPIFAVRTTAARAELALVRQDLLWCRALCQQNVRSASQQGYVRGIAEASHRLALVLRMLGRRREAEHQIRSARDAVAEVGDAVLDAETRLALATLLAERGEHLPARHLLDGTIRRIRGLALHHLLPRAMRLALKIAILAGEATEATVAIAGIEELPAQDPESPAALVQWWRTRGDTERALGVPPPDDSGYGAVLWRIERGRAALSGGHIDEAVENCDLAIVRSTELGFAELQTYARLVRGVAAGTDDGTWATLQRNATESMYTEVFLGAVEMDARRLQPTDPATAKTRWRMLHARSQELGYEPGMAESEGWLADEEVP